MFLKLFSWATGLLFVYSTFFLLKIAVRYRYRAGTYHISSYLALQIKAIFAHYTFQLFYNPNTHFYLYPNLQAILIQPYLYRYQLTTTIWDQTNKINTKSPHYVLFPIQIVTLFVVLHSIFSGPGTPGPNQWKKGFYNYYRSYQISSATASKSSREWWRDCCSK